MYALVLAVLLAVPSAAPPRLLPAVRIVNTTQVDLLFDIPADGPSALKGMAVWMTRDDGVTWERVRAAGVIEVIHSIEIEGRPARTAVVTVEVPAEGVVFGVWLCPKGRAGRDGPRRGGAPHFRLELDTTRPVACLYQPVADPDRPDHLVFSWGARDKNLADRPISLEWAECREGPWSHFGERWMPNGGNGVSVRPGVIAPTGNFTCRMTGSIPHQAYLRLSVRDRAGNVGVATTQVPVLLDLSRPSGSVRVVD
jgi:hypothetical protein